jgi:hypothetical protein
MVMKSLIFCLGRYSFNKPLTEISVKIVSFFYNESMYGLFLGYRHSDFSGTTIINFFWALIINQKDLPSAGSLGK